MSTSITYDGNSLQTTSIITADISHASMPEKDAKLFALAHANNSVRPFADFPSKRIRVSGKVIGSSVPDLDTKLDTFRGYFVADGKNLDIGYAGATRRFNVITVNAVEIDRPGGLSHANFTIEFICSPFGTNTSNTTALSQTGRTARSYADSHTFVGNAPVQLPVVTITYTAVTGATDQYVYFGNQSTGQAIVVTRTWAANDVLVIDCSSLLRPVTVNGLAVAFTGAFPEFPAGSQTMQYVDNFATRTFDINVVYKAAYL